MTCKWKIGFEVVAKRGRHRRCENFKINAYCVASNEEMATNLREAIAWNHWWQRNRWRWKLWSLEKVLCDHGRILTVNRSDSASWKGLSLSYPAFRQDSGPLQVNSQQPSSMAAYPGIGETLNPAQTNVTTSDFNATFITLFQLHLSMAAKEAGEENFKQNQISSKSVFFFVRAICFVWKANLPHGCGLWGKESVLCGGRNSDWSFNSLVANLFNEFPQVYEYVRIWLLRWWSLGLIIWL